MRNVFLGLAAIVVLVGCQSAVQPTPQIIYVTPVPTVAAATPSASPVPSEPPQSNPPPAAGSPAASALGAGVVAAGAGAWVVSEITSDPVTSQPTAITQIAAESGQSKYGQAITLLIRCKDGATALYIGWGQFLGLSKDGQLVTTRLGAAGAQTSVWSLSTDQQATFYSTSASQTISFVKSMFAETHFVAQTTPYSDSPRTAIFDISGAETAMANVRAACKW